MSCRLLKLIPIAFAMLHHSLQSHMLNATGSQLFSDGCRKKSQCGKMLRKIADWSRWLDRAILKQLITKELIREGTSTSIHAKKNARRPSRCQLLFHDTKRGQISRRNHVSWFHLFDYVSEVRQGEGRVEDSEEATEACTAYTASRRHACSFAASSVKTGYPLLPSFVCNKTCQFNATAGLVWFLQMRVKQAWLRELLIFFYFFFHWFKGLPRAIK